MFEDEHPLAEREAVSGKRNIILYHTAGEETKPLKDHNPDLIGDIYSFEVITEPEAKTWDTTYNKVIGYIEGSG